MKFGNSLDEKTKTKFYQDLTDGKIDAIVFGSGLSAKNFFKMLIEKASLEKLRSIIEEKVTTVTIGPTAAKTLMEMDTKVTLYLKITCLRMHLQHWPNSGRII